MSATGRGAPAQSATADREIVISRVISAPRELVFEAFTEVRHLSRWWGPEGFTTTTRAFEFRVGGEWDFVMHGPDGTDYQEWISWTEIAPPERIALLHGESRGDPNAFESVLTFAPDGAATRIEMRTVFPTKELRDEAVEKRDPWERPGGTTFHFVNDGIEPALDQAREAAGDRDVRIAGGGATILEYVNAGLIDEFTIALSPVLFGSGIRLFEGVDAGRVALEPVRAEPAQRVTHLTYTVRER